MGPLYEVRSILTKNVLELLLNTCTGGSFSKLGSAPLFRCRHTRIHIRNQTFFSPLQFSAVAALFLCNSSMASELKFSPLRVTRQDLRR